MSLRNIYIYKAMELGAVCFDNILDLGNWETGWLIWKDTWAEICWCEDAQSAADSPATTSTHQHWLKVPPQLRDTKTNCQNAKRPHWIILDTENSLEPVLGGWYLDGFPINSNNNFLEKHTLFVIHVLWLHPSDKFTAVIWFVPCWINCENRCELMWKSRQRQVATLDLDSNLPA